VLILIGCSGVFCESCEQLHSSQVCGVSRVHEVTPLLGIEPHRSAHRAH
jgi:hypothetical protein